MSHDPAGRSRGQHEPIGLLRGDRRATKPVTTHAGRFQNLVSTSWDYQHLSKRGISLNVPGLLEKVCADASGGLTEKFRDVQDSERTRAQRCG
jgi:hypothetical protein